MYLCGAHRFCLLRERLRGWRFTGESCFVVRVSFWVWFSGTCLLSKRGGELSKLFLAAVY